MTEYEVRQIVHEIILRYIIIIVGIRLIELFINKVIIEPKKRKEREYEQMIYQQQLYQYQQQQNPYQQQQNSYQQPYDNYYNR